MYSRSYDRIFYFKSRIRKSVLPLGTYVKSIRIIDKYRAKLLQNLIIRRHSFLETNNYLRYIPVSKHSFVKFLVQYLFDFRYRKKSQRKLQFEHIMHLRRHVGLYYKDTSK